MKMKTAHVKLSVTAYSFIIIYFVTSNIHVVSCIKPGAQVRLTNAGFDYGVGIAVQSLKTAILHDPSLPPFHGGGYGLSFQLTKWLNIPIHDHFIKNKKIAVFFETVGGPRLKVNSFGIWDKSLRPVPNKGILWKLAGVWVSLHGDYSYKYQIFFIKISDHGTLRVSGSGMSLNLLVKITANTKTGHPVLSATSCNCHVDDLSVEFTGGHVKWLYNLLAKLAKGRIKDIVEKAVCKEADKAVNVDGNKALKKLKLTTPIAHVFLLNYGFIQNPQFTSKYLETFHKGEVLWAKDLREAPITPPALPPLANTTKMVYIWLSEYIANTFAYSAFTHNYLHYNITADKLPKSSRHYLNTTCAGSMGCIGAIIHQIGAKYPNCTVKIAVNATQAPTASITPSNIGAHGLGEAKFYAVTHTGQEHFMLHLSVKMAVTATSHVADNIIYAHVHTLSLTFHVLKSTVGDVQDIILNAMAKLAIGLVVKPKLNEMGAKGFNLPVTGVLKFKDPVLSLVKGAIVIQSDVLYKNARDISNPEHPWMDEARSMDVVGDGGRHPIKM